MRVFGNQSQQGQVASFLKSSAARLLILCGPPHLGKGSFISSALEAEIHPLDCLLGGSGVDDVRAAADFCSVAPNGSPYRAAVLVGDMSHSAQSALLKVSEEPCFNSKIVLVVEDDSALSAPLLSRASCTSRWSPLSREEMKEFASASALSDEHAGLCRGRPGLLRLIGQSHLKLHEALTSLLLRGAWDHEIPDAINEAKPSSAAERELAMVIVHGVSIDAIHAGAALPRVIPFLKFVSDMRKFPSAPADVHWWRACLSSLL